MSHKLTLEFSRVADGYHLKASSQMGEAGKRQVPGNPKTGLAQAWGDLMQVGTVIVMGV